MLNRDEVTPSDDRPEKMHGWLIVIMIQLLLGGVYSVFWNIKYDDGSHNGWIFLANALNCLIYAFGCFYTVDAFIKRKDKSVFWAKCLMTYFLFNAFVIICRGEYPYMWIETVYNSLFYLVLGIAGLVYLCRSKQVRRLFPPEKQKPSKKEWTVLSICIAIPFCFFVAAVIDSMFPKEEDRKPFVELLPSYEYSFGRMIWSPPINYTCGQGQNDEPIIEFFTPNGAYGSVCSKSVYPYYTLKDKIDKEVFPNLKAEQLMNNRVIKQTTSRSSSSETYEVYFDLYIGETMLSHGVLVAKQLNLAVVGVMFLYVDVGECIDEQNIVNNFYNSIKLK